MIKKNIYKSVQQLWKEEKNKAKKPIIFMVLALNLLILGCVISLSLIFVYKTALIESFQKLTSENDVVKNQISDLSNLYKSSSYGMAFWKIIFLKPFFMGIFAIFFSLFFYHAIRKSYHLKNFRFLPVVSSFVFLVVNIVLFTRDLYSLVYVSNNVFSPLFFDYNNVLKINMAVFEIIRVVFFVIFIIQVLKIREIKIKFASSEAFDFFSKNISQNGAFSNDPFSKPFENYQSQPTKNSSPVPEVNIYKEKLLLNSEFLKTDVFKKVISLNMEQLQQIAKKLNFFGTENFTKEELRNKILLIYNSEFEEKLKKEKK